MIKIPKIDFRDYTFKFKDQVTSFKLRYTLKFPKKFPKILV